MCRLTKKKKMPQKLRGIYLAPINTFHRNIIFSQPYIHRVSTHRLNREGSQLAASVEGESGPTPAGKTLPHSYSETRFRRDRALAGRKLVAHVFSSDVSSSAGRGGRAPSSAAGGAHRGNTTPDQANRVDSGVCGGSMEARAGDWEE